MNHPLHFAAAAFVAFTLLGAGGCHAYVEPAQPVGYTEVTAAPVDIQTYPSVVYEGRPVYFYGDRWWYSDGGNWTYYRAEPEGLRLRRDEVRAIRRDERMERREERRDEHRDRR